MNLVKITLLLIMIASPNGYAIEGVRKYISVQDTTYNKEQYDLLKKCSKNKDTTEWNSWRRENPKEKIMLAGTNLQSFELIRANLENADLSGAHLFNTNISEANLKGANLEEAYFIDVVMNSAVLTHAKLNGSSLLDVKASNSNFDYVEFKNVDIKMTHIESCTFIGANFSHANIWDQFSGPKNRLTIFRKCNFTNSNFTETMAKNVDFRHSDFSNVVFSNADLSQSDLWYANFDINDMQSAKRLFHTKFLLEDYDKYLLLKDKEVFFCDQKQYKHLQKCSERKDLSEWNEWNSHTGYIYTGKQIYLAGADLENLFLEKARLVNADLRGALFIGTNLKEAHLDNANLEEAYMNSSPCFDHASLHGASLKNASLGPATFRNASLFEADLENTDLGLANFSGADLRRANLKNAKSILAANFEKACLAAANLEGANLYKCNFCGMDFHRGIVDGTTSMYQCQVDRETDFRCVSLDSIGIDSTTKRFLEYNIRRKNWDDWYWLTTYEEEKKLYSDHGPKRQIRPRNIIRFVTTLPVRGFWWISDYGTNPSRILKVFLAIWVLFTLLYYKFPDWITNLAVSKGASSTEPSKIRLFTRSLYFAAFTMMSLSFGDMHPNPDSKGKWIVLIQVITAYFLLAAIITYLGILFTSGGPFLIYTYPLRDLFP